MAKNLGPQDDNMDSSFPGEIGSDTIYIIVSDPISLRYFTTLDLVYIADYRRVAMVPVTQRESYASAAAGAIA
jgi:hypothetical protein